MKMKFIALLIIMASTSSNNLSAQCVNSSNIYAFIYDGKSYEVIRENKTWMQAALCAVERGGYLAEINNEDEQSIMFEETKLNASIITSNTTAFECGSCVFVWIGGSDYYQEGDWLWDGDNDGTGPQFWMGGVNGNPVDGLYSNWGTEPDNFNDQDGLGLGLINWILGDAGQWNDLHISNTLYFVIEYDMILGTKENELENGLIVYPNPVQNELTIINRNAQVINKIEILSVLGRNIKTIDTFNQTTSRNIDITNLEPGVYFLYIHFENEGVLCRKIVKQ